MVNKITLNTREIVLSPEHEENVSKMFSKSAFFRTYIDKYRAKEVLTKLLNDLGIIQNVSSTGVFSKNNLYFDEPTLIIRPRIENNPVGFNDSISRLIVKKFSKYSGYKIEMKSNSVNAPLDNNIKRLMFENAAVADYYPKRNLIIINFNMIPKYPKLTIIKVVCDFLKEVLEHNNIVIQNTVNPEEREKLDKERHIKLFVEHIDIRKNNIEKEINLSYRNIKDYNKVITDKYKSIQTKGVELEAIDKFKKNFKDNFEKQLKELEKLKFVKNVTISSIGILIDVGNLSMNHKNSKVYIGHISFLIKPNEVEILNKYSMGKYQHPHVHHNNPCLGSQSEGINKLIGQIDLKRLVFALYQFLHTYTYSGAYGGSKLNDWKAFRNKQGIFDNDGNLIKKITKQKKIKQIKSDKVIQPNVNNMVANALSSSNSTNIRRGRTSLRRISR